MCAAKSSKEANRDHQYEPGLAVKPVTNKAMKNVYKPVINTKLFRNGKPILYTYYDFISKRD